MKRRSEAGQTLVLAALGLVVLMLSAGLAIDMGYLRYEKRRIQAAADSAALAGAADLQYPYYQASGQVDASYNGFTNDPGCDPAAAKCISVNIISPPLGNDPFQGQTSYVEATIVDSNVPTFFMRIVGINSETLSARAVAHVGNGDGCFYGLGLMGSAIYSDGYDVGFDVYAPSCGVFSNSSMTLNSEIIDAGYVGCAQACTGGVITPNPVTIVPAANPLAYLAPEQPPGTCTGSPMSITGGTPGSPIQLTPSSLGSACGVSISGNAYVEFTNGSAQTQIFSGPISIAGSANVTFDPGTYVLGNGLSISPDPTSTSFSVTGTGVTFYTAGTTGSVNICVSPLVITAACPNTINASAAVTINLSAPTDLGAPYPGVLFFQDPRNVIPATINGGNIYAEATTGSTTLQGAMYFPDAALNLINVASSTTIAFPPANPLGYAVAVANQLYVGGSIQFGNNWPNGISPVKNTVLAE